MGEAFFKDVEAIKYEGPDTESLLAFRYYDADRKVLGKTMAEHLRMSVCYWHTFCWPGVDMFGQEVFDRPWFGGDPMDDARLKADVAFEFFEKLGLPFYCFHDRDLAPEGSTLSESNGNLDAIAEYAHGHMERTGVKLLWGTANLFGHPRYAAGASTNPDPEVFAYAAAQVKHMLDVTKRLGGVNYVLWGGREGYETLLNTDLKREDAQLGRFLNLVAEYKHKIGFEGQLLIEPKPQEPTKHQYDFDAAACHAFLQRHGIDGEYKLNIEGNHATLAGHTLQHEVAYAVANGIFGSIDANRGDLMCGWDTDQFPNNIEDVTLAMYEILRGGGFTQGGFNFDAKIRRQSLDPIDLFHAHVGGIDITARGLLAAAKMIEDASLQDFVDDRYAGWDAGLGQKILGGKASLDSLAEQVEENGIDPKPKSGRQEMLENIVNRYI